LSGDHIYVPDDLKCLLSNTYYSCSQNFQVMFQAIKNRKNEALSNKFVRTDTKDVGHSNCLITTGFKAKIHANY